MNELIRTHSFAEKDTEISISQDQISYQGNTVSLTDVTGIRTSVTAIEFYKFGVGVKYYIGLQTATDQLDIIFKSYFGIRNGYFSRLTDQILEEIWEPVTQKLWNDFREILGQKGGEISVGNCRITEQGVVLWRSGLLKEKQELIPWADLSYQKKYDRLVINSRSNPKLFTNLYYNSCWNIEVLMALLDWLSKEENTSTSSEE